MTARACDVDACCAWPFRVSAQASSAFRALGGVPLRPRAPDCAAGTGPVDGCGVCADGHVTATIRTKPKTPAHACRDWPVACCRIPCSSTLMPSDLALGRFVLANDFDDGSQRRSIGPPAESHDRTPNGGGQYRMLVDFVARPEIRDMHLDHRKRHRLDDVVNRDAAEAEAGAIDQRSIHVVDVLLESIDNDRLG